MVRWKIHDKWAMRLGISKEVSNYINRLIDRPRDIEEYKKYIVEFIGIKFKPLKLHINKYEVDPISLIGDGRDSSRAKATPAYVQLSFLSKKGREYILAWYLHHMIDYISATYQIYNKNELTSKLEKKLYTTAPNNLNFKAEFDIVLNFILKNWEKLIRDITPRN